MSVSKKPMVLVILDGYGYREDQQDNAIYSAKTPVMDALWALSLIHISEPTRLRRKSRMPSSA